MSRRRDERGATLPLFAICLTVLLAMAAFATDLGLLFVERREAQAAADSGVLGGALDLANGMDAASEASAALVRSNLSTPYTDAEWAALWAACVDPSALAFTGKVLGTPTSCISFDGLGLYRVIVPDQIVPSAFASVVGIDEFSAGAFAEVELTINGVGGVLPFAVLGNAPSGSHICMRSSTNGTATPPRRRAPDLSRATSVRSRWPSGATRNMAPRTSPATSTSPTNSPSTSLSGSITSSRRTRRPKWSTAVPSRSAPTL